MSECRVDLYKSRIRLRDLHIQPGYIIDAQENVENFITIINSLKFTNSTFIVMRESQPVGMIRTNDMLRHLGNRFGFSLYADKPINKFMYPGILMMDWNTSIEEVSRKAMARSYEEIYDDIIVMGDGEYQGVVPIYELLNAITDYRIREAIQRNPLTKLPGNERIEEIFHTLLQQKQAFTVIYVDIDHFKGYNDVYGFQNGDNVLKWVGGILQKPTIANLFVGHIGGDDFAIFLSPEYAETYCKKVIKLFEQEREQFYSQEDVQRGYIEALDREHMLKKFPFISISMAVLDVETEDITLAACSSLTAAIKKKTKQVQGCCYIRESTIQSVM